LIVVSSHCPSNEKKKRGGEKGREKRGRWKTRPSTIARNLCKGKKGKGKQFGNILTSFSSLPSKKKKKKKKGGEREVCKKEKSREGVR